MIYREIRRFVKSSPLLSLSAAAVLALGLGGTSLALAMLWAFSSLQAPGTRSLGYATITQETEGGGSLPVSWASIKKLRSVAEPGVSVASYSSVFKATLDRNGHSDSANLAAVSAGFFNVFTTHLTAGRDFNNAEGEQKSAHVLILSVPFAVKLFRSPAQAVNQFVTLGGTSYQVIGVAPRGFAGLFGKSVAGWTPVHSVIPLIFALPPAMAKMDPDAWRDLAVFYGLAESSRMSSSELAFVLSRSLPLHAKGLPDLQISQGLTIDPVRDAKVRDWLRLGVLLAFLFVVVSALNYALLLLARAPRYADEIRLKRALGAGSGRLLAELMVGPAFLMGIGLIVACAIWEAGLRLISAASPFLKNLVRGSWHGALLAFGLQIPFACALTVTIALIPALVLLREENVPRLGYSSTASRRSAAGLQGLVTLQIASCIGSWILAGMIVSALVFSMSQGLGYDTNHLVVIDTGFKSPATFKVNTSKDTFPPHAIIENMLQELEVLPGVRGASLTNAAPFGTLTTLTVMRSGDGTGSHMARSVDFADISPGYFRTIGAHLLRGSGFSWTDVATRTDKIVVNQMLAEELWGNESPVGQSVKLSEFYSAIGRSFSSEATVSGVVENIDFGGYGELPKPMVFRSLHSAYVGFSLLINGSESLSSLQTIVRGQLAALEPPLAITDIYSVRDRARASLQPGQQRSEAALAGALLIALVAYIGLYGTLAYYVNTRRRELAVRICLGADSWKIRRIILARAARCACLGALLSAPLWPLLAELSSYDYLGPASWSTGRAIVLMLICIAVAISVSLIPARAAVRISPAEVLKEL